MILICEIVDAVQREIRSAYPDAAQYIDQAPETPQMPGFVTQYIAMVTKDANRWHVNLTRYFTITCLAQPGQDDQPNATEHLQMQENVINRFGCGYLKVGDRALRAVASAGGREADKAFVDLQLEYLDDRGIDEEQREPMGEVSAIIKEE